MSKEIRSVLVCFTTPQFPDYEARIERVVKEDAPPIDGADFHVVELRAGVEIFHERTTVYQAWDLFRSITDAQIERVIQS